MKHEEDKLQMQCVAWFRLQYPKLEKLLFINHNNPRSKIDGYRLKKMGLVAGVADMTFLYKNKVYFIEFKSSKGKLSEAQIDWQKTVLNEGFLCITIRTIYEFMEFINGIVKK